MLEYHHECESGRCPGELYPSAAYQPHGRNAEVHWTPTGDWESPRLDAAFEAEFHDYTFRWSDTFLDFFIDGVHVRRADHTALHATPGDPYAGQFAQLMRLDLAIPHTTNPAHTQWPSTSRWTMCATLSSRRRRRRRHRRRLRARRLRRARRPARRRRRRRRHRARGRVPAAGPAAPLLAAAAGGAAAAAAAVSAAQLRSHRRRARRSRHRRRRRRRCRRRPPSHPPLHSATLSFRCRRRRRRHRRLQSRRRRRARRRSRPRRRRRRPPRRRRPETQLAVIGATAFGVILVGVQCLRCFRRCAEAYRRCCGARLERCRSRRCVRVERRRGDPEPPVLSSSGASRPLEILETGKQRLDRFGAAARRTAVGHCGGGRLDAPPPATRHDGRGGCWTR